VWVALVLLIGRSRIQILGPAFHNPFFFRWLYSPCGPWPLLSVFMIIFTDGRTSWTSDQLVARPLPKHRINTYTYQTSMPCVGFEPMTPASERAETVHALGRSATVTGFHNPYISLFNCNHFRQHNLRIHALYLTYVIHVSAFRHHESKI
jgi:hypothetical protein